MTGANKRPLAAPAVKGRFAGAITRANAYETGATLAVAPVFHLDRMGKHLSPVMQIPSARLPG